jgi:predicted flap endonuclease-1-like 5' DNA nuclease
MSLYTVGEIVVWMLLAAVLGFALGWLLRGLLRPQGPKAPALEVEREPPGQARTRVAEVDTGAAGTRTEAVPISRFAPVDEVRPAEPEPEDPVAAIARRAAGGLTPPHDDLVRVHGVGPKIAALLNERGITSFRQVARLAPEDVPALEEALGGGFRGRIARDDWIGSARGLHREVYGVEP